MSLAKTLYRGTKEYALIQAELIMAAKYRGTITYQEIAKIIGLPLEGNYMGAQIGHLLGEISEDEVEKGRPMLSAVAINTQGTPGPGFFDWARQLGRLGDNMDEKAFWQAERKAVYETWKTILK
ncbi:MAG: hypothetical protein AB1564_09565 [Chloroflexota bacterium]